MAVREIPKNMFGQYEVEVEGRTYLLYSLDPMAQIIVACRIGPTILRMFRDGGGEVAQALRATRGNQVSSADALKAAYPALEPIVAALAGLSEDTLRGIVKAVLAGSAGAHPHYKKDGKPGVSLAWDKENDRPADKEMTGLGLLTLVGQALMREFDRTSSIYAAFADDVRDDAGAAASAA